MSTLSNKVIRNIGIQLGVVAGVLSIAYFFSLYLTKAYLFDAFYKFDFWITVPFIIMGIIALRKSADKVTIGNGLVMGFYTVIVCASVVALFYYIFLTYLDTDFIKESEQYRLGLLTNKIKEVRQGTDKEYLGQLTDQLKATHQMIKKGNTPWGMATDRIITNYFIGGLFTLILAILLRKTKK
jgi:Protein of unknown function (DUF4199)